MMAEPVAATRPSLLLRLREPRDAEAWGAFVEAYGPLVYSHSRRRGLRHEDAEDVAQKVFTRIANAIRTFSYNPQQGRFRDWMGTIVRNEINRFLKNDQRPDHAVGETDEQKAILDGVASPTADSEWSADFQQHLLQLAMERCQPRFEPATWHAFELVWLKNRPAPEVAEELNKPLDWVYVAKSRVLKQLGEVVQELAEDSVLPLESLRGS